MAVSLSYTGGPKGSGYLTDDEEFKDHLDLYMAYLAWDYKTEDFFTAAERIPLHKCESMELEGI